MRGRRGSRSAAVVLAGCVGLAVMAPGLAVAAPVPELTTPEACEAVAGNTWTAAGCDDGTPATSTTATTTTTPPPAVDDTEAGDTETDDATAPSTSTTPPSAVTSVDPVAPRVGAENSATEQVPGDPGTEAVTGPQPISAAALTGNVSTLQSEVDEALALEDLPLADLLPLPDLPDIIPLPDADGNFENVNDACLNAISQLQFPEGTEGLDVLSEQLQGFCSTLDPTTLTDLLDSLLDLLGNLIPSLPTPNTNIPNEAPHDVPAHYWGYWHHQYDVDCPELTYDEANAILAWDRSDPFRLDRDNDGEACEANAHGDDVEYVVYESYPVGGVATGDGSTGSGASGVEVALAAGMVSGLGVTGLALVRRFARQG